MHAVKNLYSILGINRSASLSEIRKAYRRKALEFHPDKNSNASANSKFIEINEAYSVLKNVRTKVRYDLLYDKYILKPSKTVEKPSSRKENSQFNRVRHRTNRGREEANKYAKMDKATFEKKSAFWSFADGFSWVIELIGNFMPIF